MVVARIIVVLGMVAAGIYYATALVTGRWNVVYRRLAKHAARASPYEVRVVALMNLIAVAGFIVAAMGASFWPGVTLPPQAVGVGYLIAIAAFLSEGLLLWRHSRDSSPGSSPNG